MDKDTEQGLLKAMTLMNEALTKMNDYTQALGKAVKYILQAYVLMLILQVVLILMITLK